MSCEVLELLERVEQFVRVKESGLRNEYGDDYLAIHYDEVIDHDADRSKLNGRIQQSLRQGVLIVNIDNLI